MAMTSSAGFYEMIRTVICYEKKRLVFNYVTDNHLYGVANKRIWKIIVGYIMR
jgi:hypothetical protein